MIITEYRVSVGIPNKVWEKFQGSNSAFERDRMQACHGSLESGTDYSSSDPFEWATFDDLQKAQACERKLMGVMYKYAAKLL